MDQESIVQIIFQSLQSIDQFDLEQKENVQDFEDIIYSMIQTFRYLDHDKCISLNNNKIKHFKNIFKNVLLSSIDFNLDLSIVLFAYFSILPFLHHLIDNTDLNELNHIFSLKYNDMQSNPGNNIINNPSHDKPPLPGVFSVIRQVQDFKIFDKNLLSFLNWKFSKVYLLKHWFQSWVSYKDKHIYYGTPLISRLLQNESDLDFFLINNTDLNQFPDTLSSNINKYTLLFDKIYYRICLLDPKWVPKDLYVHALNHLLDMDKQIDSLEFNLQVIMELIDHPEYNLLEMPRLLVLLYLSLLRVENTPCTQLHNILNHLSTTQTLLSVINMSQFVITLFLNRILSMNQPNECASVPFYNLSKLLYKIPAWFKEEMLPDIPPISKSLFVFNTSQKDDISFSLIDTLTILYQCLNLTIVIHNNIIDQYHALKLNLIQFDDSISVQVEYLLKQQFFQNNYIPIFSTLLVLMNMYPHENNTSSKVINDQFYQMVYNSNFTLHNIKKIIIFNSIKYIESLIVSYKDIALYHLLKFVSLISQENLLLQKISIRLLNHLFFHSNADDSESNKILSLCRNNELSFNELSTYIKLWNDGTSEYSFFYSKLLNETQPMVNIENVSLRKLQELIPNMDIVLKYHENQSKKNIITMEYIDKSNALKNYNSSFPSNDPTLSTNFNHHTTNTAKNSTKSNYKNKNNNNNNNNNMGNIHSGTFSQTIQPVPQKKMKNYMSVNKYDAYTSQTFIPSSSSNMNNCTLINTNNTLNHDNLLNSYYSPHSQQAINSVGNAIYSTPLTYIQQQQQQQHMKSNFIGINIDNSNPMNMNFQSINQNEIYAQGNFPIQSNFMVTPQNLSASGNNSNNSNVPIFTPSNTMFNSPWNDSPTITINTPQNKIVSTGKDYILGGHNRVQNNSRAQSIHIDKFENI